MADQADSASFDATVFETAGLALAVFARGSGDEEDLRPAVGEVLLRVTDAEPPPAEKAAAGFAALWHVADRALVTMPRLEDIEGRAEEIRGSG